MKVRTTLSSSPVDWPPQWTSARTGAVPAVSPGDATGHGITVTGVGGRRGRGLRLRAVELAHTTVCQDGDGGGLIVGEAAGQAGGRLRHSLLAAARPGAAQVEVGAVELVVFDLDGVGLVCGQLGRNTGLFAVLVNLGGIVGGRIGDGGRGVSRGERQKDASTERPGAHESSLPEEGWRLIAFALYNVVRNGSWHDSTTSEPCPGT
jgi:hypothetical protein